MFPLLLPKQAVEQVFELWVISHIIMKKRCINKEVTFDWSFGLKLNRQETIA